MILFLSGGLLEDNRGRKGVGTLDNNAMAFPTNMLVLLFVLGSDGAQFFHKSSFRC